MKFCPKCGGIMLPVRKDGKIVLKCQRCGYEMPADEKTLKQYKIVRKTREEDKVVTTKTVVEAEKLGVDKETLEQAKEEFYELVLDQIGEYGE